MRRLFVLVLVSLLLVGFVPAQANAQGNLDTVRSALVWMRAQQQLDGSFPGFGPGDTADALVAIVAVGEGIASFNKGGTSPLDYLEAQASTYAPSSTGAAAKLAMAVIAAKADPTNFGGENLLALIGKSYDPATGQYGPDLYGHALALLATRAAGANPPPAAISRLLDLQLDDGGWSFDGTSATGSDTNTTSLVVQALVGQAQADSARGAAIAYFATQQNDDGGFPYSQASSFGSDSDANSTALAIQAILAAGEQPTEAPWVQGKTNPQLALAALQNPSGALRYQAALPDDNALATYQAVPAMLGQVLPVATASVAGAQALLVPTAAGLPATGAQAEPSIAAIALAALALLAGGLFARQRALA